MKCALAAMMSTALLVLLTEPAASADKAGTARRDANRFVLEKLNRRDGEGWDRSGQYFLWSYRFSNNGCELQVRREELYGARIVEQRIPMAETLPYWPGHGELQLVCQNNSACVDLAVDDPARRAREESRSGGASILAMQASDLPKLQDAFLELHRLCDDPYRNN